MSEKNEVQKIRLASKHPAIGVARSQDSDGFVSFSVGNRYKLLETIGTGAYGVVCSAVDSKTSCHVAIKKIVNPFEVLTTAKRTLRELKLLLHFKHDNVVGIKNIIQSEQKNRTDVYLVMDLMESDLHHIIRSEQPLSSEHVCYFLYQLLRGLKYIHSANVIHRDLKPSNLLVNENCELKIGDFGMARAVSSTPDDRKLFMTEYVATRWYRAPELMLSIGEYSQAIDIWSVGCIFAEMMGRKQIFPGRHYVHQLQLVISVLGSPTNDLVTSIRSDRVRNYVRNLPHREPVKLKTLYPKASEQMLELLQSFLQFNPAQRPTAEQTLRHSFFNGYHDSDDEPKCPLPFDFRFESTVTRDEVRSQVTSVIGNYCDRRNRLSKQLMVVNNTSNSVQPTAHTVGSNTRLPTTTPSQPHSVTTVASIVSGSHPVFKKPPVPSTTPKIVLPKPAPLSPKPCSEDIDMKSANSVCSMDLSVELEPKSISNHLRGGVKVGEATVKVSNKSNKTVSTTDNPMITVQVVQDSTVDLTQISSEKDDDDKKQAGKQKKEGEKSKKGSSSAPKKTTISENTKMKIRDSIFASMLAKQKGLGKPLEKVKKTVTAAERQREREEKRKKRQERAAEKERKREEEMRKKNELSDADKSLLDRWKKMQECATVKEPQTTESSLPPKPERSNSSKRLKEDKQGNKGLNRHKSLPASSSRPTQFTSMSTQDQGIRVQENQTPVPPSHYAQPNKHRIITVVLNNPTNKPQDPTEVAIASNRKLSSVHESAQPDNVTLNPPQYIRDIHTATSSQNNTSIVSNFTTEGDYANMPYSLQQHRYTVPITQPQLRDQHGFIPEDQSTDQSAQGDNVLIRSINQHAVHNPDDPANSRIMGSEGGLFIPESEGAVQNDAQFPVSKPDQSATLQRPTSLFTHDASSKVSVLVGNELMTPGKALQHSSLISTPQGRNLATISPDTIDFVLNEEFQKRTNIESSVKQSNPGRPASYPSVVNAQDPPVFSEPSDSMDSSSSRSKSITYLTSMPGDVSSKIATSTSKLREHSRSEPPPAKVTTDSDKTNTGSSSTSSLFQHVQDLIDGKKSNTESSFEFSPAAFLKSLDDADPFVVDKAAEQTVVSTTDNSNGGVFVPHLDAMTSLSVPQYSVAMSEVIPSAGAASALGYGLGVDISDIIPPSAGEGGGSNLMDYATPGDQSDSSLLADWLNFSELRPQDMEALQRELELGSPMSIDGT